MQKAKPFSIPKIVDIFIVVCLIDKFGKYLSLNRTWYTWCRDELWKWHKEAEQVYGRVVDKYREADDPAESYFLSRFLQELMTM
ncbi:hypothetical protein GLOIN_2v1779779 [Rhizophagus irregularis DAOM 181602=DAOM 197198]|nr:hypothetical protein GLOIN_2v1779779 [Rhizophagus irregularis DAOM 181602=DAOM 197198]